MPLSVARVLPGRAGKIIFVCAVSSVCAAYLVSHDRAARNNEPGVSLVSKESASATDRALAHAPTTASTPASTPAATASAASSAPASQAPAFTVKNALIEHSFGAAVRSMGLDASTAALLTRAFRGNLNFSRDLRPGDRVSAVFDESSGKDTTGE